MRGLKVNFQMAVVSMTQTTALQKENQTNWFDAWKIANIWIYESVAIVIRLAWGLGPVTSDQVSRHSTQTWLK